MVFAPSKYYFIAAAFVEASLQYFCLLSYEISLRPDGRSLGPNVGLKARGKRTCRLLALLSLYLLLIQSLISGVL